MIDNLVTKFVDKQILLGNIKSEEVSVYQYGYTLLLERIINVIIAVCISVVMKNYISVVLFLFAFIPIRTFAGGWHSKKFLLCTVLSNITIILGTILYNKSKSFQLILLIVLESLLFFILAFFSPIESPSKRITQKEQFMYKKNVIVILVIHYIIEVFLYSQKWSGSMVIFVFAHLVVAISLIIGKIVNRKNLL